MYTIGGQLYHHGILGMKWGVRRYQNYDGTYTKKGLDHYKESYSNYKKAKEEHKSIKEAYKKAKKEGSAEINGRNVDKGLIKESKRNVKEAKRQLSKDYDQLKKDKAGDIGKEIYRSGRTITGNSQNLKMAAYIASGTAMVSSFLLKNGNMKAAQYTALAGAGLEVVNGILAAKNGVEAHYLRAYYSHNRADRPYADKVTKKK